VSRGIAVIPARGGSKRIPRKNLLRIAGRPMIERPIEAARSTKGVSHVIVSTDDEEIAELALELGAVVEGRRPKHLAADDTPTAPVVVHEVDRYCLENHAPSFVVVLYPSSIFVTSSDLQHMVQRLDSPDVPVEMVMTVTKYPAPIERAWLLGEGDLGIIANPSTRSQQSQAFPDHYYDVGQAYVSSPGAWRALDEGRTVPTALHILPPWKSWDINTPDDFAMAEVLLRHSSVAGHGPKARETTPTGTERARER
jgi:pseudaminic acid cytidylyltransferase